MGYTYNVDGTTATMYVQAPGESTPHWTWTFNYSGGRLDNITDPAGRTTDIAVNDHGQLSNVTFPDGSSEAFFYDARGLLTQHMDRDGAATTYAYDAYGRIQSDTRPIRAVYDPDTGESSALSEVRTFTPSDTAYHLINDSIVGDPDSPAPAAPTSTLLVDSITYGRGELSGVTNEWGNWLERTDGTGRTTAYERDEANNVTGVTLSNGDCLDASYDEFGNLLTVARVEATECGEAEPASAQTAAYTYEPRFNQIKTITDARGATTTYVYDYEEDAGEEGLLVRIEYPPVENENGVVVTPTVSYTYNSLGLVTTETDARGTVTRYVYTEGTGDEAAGGANPLFAPGVPPVPGLLTQVIQDDGGEALTTTYKEFDALGNPLSVIGPGGANVTRFLYDEMGRVISQTNATDITTLSQYDDQGNLARRITDYTADGATGRNVVTAFTYDADNRLVQVDDWNTGVTTYQYDGAGRLITTTLPNGVVSVNAYDDANRLLSLRHEGGDGSLLAEYLYQLDSVGNRAVVTETVRAPDVVQTIDAYIEQNGLLVLEAENGTATATASHDWVTQTVQAGYEGAGYSRALPDIGARYEETETASSPHLSWPIYNETGGTYSVWVRSMAPDAGGDSLHVSLDGGAPSSGADLTGFTNEWDWSRVTPTSNATLDLSTTGEHTLEAYMREDGLRVDRVLLITDTNYIPTDTGPAESPFQTITQTIPGGLGTTSIAYQYDDLYRLTDATYSGAITATFVYVYDFVGNMTAFTETVDAQTTSVIRSFDAANRLQTSFDATAGTTSYIYDNNGNLTEVYPPGSDTQNPVEVLRYAYDQHNMLVSHETNPDGTAWVLQAEYVYDGGSDRLQQVDYTGATPITTTYTNDTFGLTQVLVADDGPTQVYNLFGLDLISQDSGSEVRTLLVDGLGSVRMEMVSGVVEVATTYSPYGEVLAQAGASRTTYGFTGEQEDSATGLLYLRARYYNPELKVFHSRDPWEGTGWRPETLNYYQYASGNPVNYTDPSGLCAEIGDEICWELAERAWREGFGPLDYLRTLSVAELRLILGGTRFYCTENYGCFDTGHINPGKVDEVLRDIERYLQTKQLIDMRGGFGPDSGFVAYYSVSEGLTPEQKQGVALGILMDYEIRWERLQGTIPFGPGGASSFAIEDLPSDYLGYIIGFNYCPEERNDAIFDLFELLGGARPVESIPHPTTQIMWTEASRIPQEGSVMNTYVMNIPIPNREFTPLVEIDGEWQNIAWPEELRLTSIDSSSGLWQHERSGFCFLGIPWLPGDCNS